MFSETGRAGVSGVFSMRMNEHNTRRVDRSPQTCCTVALTLGRRWYFDLFYFWFIYQKGGSRG